MRLVDRLLCGAVTRWDASNHKLSRMSYVDFVWFLISEEDKTTSTRLLLNLNPDVSILLHKNVLIHSYNL